MTHDGKMGSVPAWYTILRAAKYLGVPPWDLLDQPAIWLNWALAAENSENLAEKNRLRKKTDVD